MHQCSAMDWRGGSSPYLVLQEASLLKAAIDDETLSPRLDLSPSPPL